MAHTPGPRMDPLGEFFLAPRVSTRTAEGSRSMGGARRPAGRLGSLSVRTPRRSPGTAMEAARALMLWWGLSSGEIGRL